MSSHTPSTSNQFRHLSARLVGQVAAALTPVAILVTAFAIAGERLSLYTVHGVALTAVIVACAVVVPLLSQTLSAPVYAGLEDVDYTDRPLVARTVLHVLPRGAALALPVAAVAGVMLGLHAGWDAAVVATVVVLIALHLVMAMLMVVGFATRSAVGLVAGWIAYGVALATVPQPRGGSRRWPGPSCCWRWRWSAPATPRSGPDAVVADPGHSAGYGCCRRRAHVGHPAGHVGARRAQFRAFVVFAAIIPAMIAYQTFFVTMAGPLWATTSRLQDALVEPAVRPRARDGRRARRPPRTPDLGGGRRPQRDPRRPAPRGWDAVAGRSIDFALLVAGPARPAAPWRWPTSTPSSAPAAR